MHTTANTLATTPNIVDATMSGVAASVKTVSYIWRGLYMEGLIFGILRYVYVGSTISPGGDGSEEIRRRLAMAKNKLSKLKFLWNGQDPQSRQRILRAWVLLIAAYGCET